MTGTSSDDQARVRKVLEEELEQVDSPAVAEAVVERAEQLAGDETEAGRAARARAAPTAAGAAVEQALAAPTPTAAAAAALTTAAGQATAETPEASAVVEAAQEALGVAGAPTAPAARRGGRYLQDAVLRRLGPLQRLDARLFLAVNQLPHPRWLNGTLHGLSVLTTGGWFWIVAVLVARVRGVPRGGEALRQIVPTVVAATWLTEHPIKAVVRRRRPFIDVLRALVIGKKPGSWSFPSGHTASAFAGAWVLSTLWPRGAPLFFGLAAAIGASRVYLGTHYPGDVASGALLGTVLAELVRLAITRRPPVVVRRRKTDRRYFPTSQPHFSYARRSVSGRMRFTGAN